MNIEKIKEDHYKVTFTSGEVLILSWNELCSIANFVDVETAKEEVTDFLESREGDFEEELANPNFIEDVAYNLISVRTNNETEDDVYDAISSTTTKGGTYES
jgi:hypothetical protein